MSLTFSHLPTHLFQDADYVVLFEGEISRLRSDVSIPCSCNLRHGIVLSSGELSKVKSGCGVKQCGLKIGRRSGGCALLTSAQMLSGFGSFTL